MLELVVVVAIIAVLLSLLFPVLDQARKKALVAKCWNNLHQIGIAFHSYSHDHNDHFPMQLSFDAGGTYEFAVPASSTDAGAAFRHFQVLSNELKTPKILTCPADIRVAASDFGGLKNDNVSYFAGVTASYNQPSSILSGDCNLVSSGSSYIAIRRISPTNTVRWTPERHSGSGNILMADGSVSTVAGSALPTILSRSQKGAFALIPWSKSLLPASSTNLLATVAAPAKPALAVPIAKSAPIASNAAFAAAATNAAKTPAAQPASPAVSAKSAQSAPRAVEPPADLSGLAPGGSSNATPAVIMDDDEDVPTEPGIVGWIQSIAKKIMKLGWQLNLLLLLILLLLLVLLEIRRRRVLRQARQKKK